MITMIVCGIIGIPMIMFGVTLLDNPFHWAAGMILLVIGSSISAVIPAKIASGKGRSFGKWWLYGFCLFAIALIHAITLKENDSHRLLSGDYKKCPFCAEVIKKEAAVCRYCGRDLPKPEYNSPIDFDNGIAELNKEKKQRFNDNRECPICHGICNINTNVCPYCGSHF